MDTTSGHLYIIKSEEGPVKIGISIDANKRIANISSGSGRAILRKFISPLLPMVAELEKLMHFRFRDSRGVGEWFDADFDEVVRSARLTGATKWPNQWRASEDYIKGVICRERMRQFSTLDRTEAEWFAFYAGMGSDGITLIELADHVDMSGVLASAKELDRRIAALGLSIVITQEMLALRAALDADMVEAGLKPS